MALMMRRGGEEEDEEEEERRREEREQRAERNRLRREARERERRKQMGEVSEGEDAAAEVGSSSFASEGAEYRRMFSCAGCSGYLQGRIWQCQVGHPVCRDCVDISWLGDEESVDSKSDKSSKSSKSTTASKSVQSGTASRSSRSSVCSLDRFSQISDNSVKALIEGMTESELLELVARGSDAGSHLTFSGPTLSERQIQASIYKQEFQSPSVLATLEYKFGPNTPHHRRYCLDRRI